LGDIFGTYDDARNCKFQVDDVIMGGRLNDVEVFYITGQTNKQHGIRNTHTKKDKMYNCIMKVLYTLNASGWAAVLTEMLY
jgi:hypothetical protein